MYLTNTIITAALASAALVAASPCTPPSKWGKSYGGKWDQEWDRDHDSEYKFTSKYSNVATPDQVYNATGFVGGQPGAIGYFDFGINGEKDLICYVCSPSQSICTSPPPAALTFMPPQSIRLFGVTGAYSSPALTATHIHQTAAKKAGPPRIAFPNPVQKDASAPDGSERVSKGCMTGPFKTGIVNATTGVDSGDGFKVSQIESNPAGFAFDVHNVGWKQGAVRGQLA